MPVIVCPLVRRVSESPIVPDMNCRSRIPPHPPAARGWGTADWQTPGWQVALSGKVPRPMKTERESSHMVTVIQNHSEAIASSPSREIENLCVCLCSKVVFSEMGGRGCPAWM